MVGDYADYVHAELTETMPVENIDQAMVGFRYEDQDLSRLMSGANLPFHAIVLRDKLKAFDKCVDLGFVAQIEDEPSEQAAGLGIVELVRFENIAGFGEQLRRHSRDDPRLVGTGEFQEIRRRHRISQRE
jgi:hypothetical protein